MSNEDYNAGADAQIRANAKVSPKKGTVAQTVKQNVPGGSVFGEQSVTESPIKGATPHADPEAHVEGSGVR